MWLRHGIRTRRGARVAIKMGPFAKWLLPFNRLLREDFADEVLLLSAGRVAAAGAPQQVFDRDTIAAVFEWPVTIERWRDGAPQIIPLRPNEV